MTFGPLGVDAALEAPKAALKDGGDRRPVVDSCSAYYLRACENQLINNLFVCCLGVRCCQEGHAGGRRSVEIYNTHYASRIPSDRRGGGANYSKDAVINRECFFLVISSQQEYKLNIINLNLNC